MRRPLTATKNAGLNSSQLDRLVSEAVNLFYLHGYDKVSIQDIVDTLGLTKGAFYYYLQSKEEILFLVHDRIVTYSLSQIEPTVAGPGSATERLAAIISTMINLVEEYRPYVVVFMDERRRIATDRFQEIAQKRLRYRKQVESVVADGVRNGEFLADIDPKMVTLMIFGIVNWTYQWFRSDGRYNVREIGRMCKDVIMEGILRRAGPTPALPGLAPGARVEDTA